MHERSLARTILREALHVCEQRDLGPIHGIILELGEFSGVECALLQIAVEEVSFEELGRLISVEIHPTALVARCEDCAHEFRVLDFQFHCPQCTSNRLVIIHGEELRLLSLVTDSTETTP